MATGRGSHHETFHLIATLHDLDLAAQTLRSLLEVFASVSAVGPELLQAMKQALHLDQHILASTAFGRTKKRPTTLAHRRPLPEARWIPKAALGDEKI